MTYRYSLQQLPTPIHARKPPKYPPPKVIAVDVDGTLLINGKIDRKLVDWCRRKKLDGFYIILWSARGMQHAIDVSRDGNIVDVFDTIISKPGYIVDDKGWQWIKYTKVINKFQIK